MRIQSSHWPWAAFVGAATLLATSLYTSQTHPPGWPLHLALPAFFDPSPSWRRSFGGTPLGLVFGTLALLIFLFASALGIRKKRRRWPIGRVEHWLRAHLWLTILTVPLVLLHSGWSLGGLHTRGLLLLYGVVMASGLFGAAVQHFLPRIMRQRLPREVVFEQIPHLRRALVAAAGRLREELRQYETHPAEALATATAGRPALATESAADRESAQVVIRLFDEHCRDYLAAPRGARHQFHDARAAAEVFRMTRLNVAARWHPQVDRLEGWCTERRDMDVQTRYHHWLHGWLLIHVPASIGLLIYTCWHGWVAVRFLVLSP